MEEIRQQLIARYRELRDGKGGCKFRKMTKMGEVLRVIRLIEKAQGKLHPVMVGL